MKLTLFIILFITIGQEAMSQPTVYSASKAILKNKVAVKDILGTWFYKEAPKSEIKFVEAGSYYVFIDSIKHGVGHYGFSRTGDSMPVHGVAANWPPYDCIINLIDKNTLELKFYQYFSTEFTNVLFIRK